MKMVNYKNQLNTLKVRENEGQKGVRHTERSNKIVDMLPYQ